MRKTAALEAIQLAGTGEGMEIASNIGDFALVVSLAITAAFERVAIPGGRLAALVGGLPNDGTVEICREGTMVRISCGQARFRLPTISSDQLPALLGLSEEVGQVELARADAHRLFAQSAFAASTEETRYYLNGVYLRDVDAGLAGIATDGYRLIKTTVSGVAGLSSNGLILPNAAVKIILRILSERSIERVVPRCSRTLFELSGPGFTFVSKLVDGVYPNTDRVIPTPGGNAAITSTAALRRAVECVRTVAGSESKAAPLAGLEWDGKSGVLHVSLASWDVADDFIETEMISGLGQVAVNADLLAEMLEEFPGETVRLDGDGSQNQMTPLLITDPKNADYLALLMPCRWPLAKADGGHTEKAASKTLTREQMR